MIFELYPDALATRNIEGRYPLHEFLARDRFSSMIDKKSNSKALETVDFLVTQCLFGVRVADREGMTPLHYASKNYDIGVVSYLTQAHPEGVKVHSPKFGLPLHCGAGRRTCTAELELGVVSHLIAMYPDAIWERNETLGLPLE